MNRKTIDEQFSHEIFEIIRLICSMISDFELDKLLTPAIFNVCSARKRTFDIQFVRMFADVDDCTRLQLLNCFSVVAVCDIANDDIENYDFFFFEINNRT